MFRHLTLLLLAIGSLGLARPSQAQAPEGFAPGDAAVFMYFDFAAIYKSKLGDQFRKMKVPGTEQVDKYYKMLALEQDDFLTMSAYYPAIMDPSGFSTSIVTATLKKEIDLSKVEAMLKAEKIEYALDGKKLITEPFGGLIPTPFNQKKAKTPLKERPLNEVSVIDFSTPKTVTIFSNAAAKYRDKQSAKGPQEAAIAASAKNTIVIGVNFAAFPPEIRGEDLPPEVRPFAPLLKSDSVLLTGQITGDKMDITARVRSEDDKNRIASEKSLGAMQGLFTSLLQVAKVELNKTKKPADKLLVPLVEAGIDMFSKARIRIEGQDAVASMSVTTDLPIAAVFEAMGKSSPAMSANRAQTQNNLKQLGLSIHNYESTHNHMPPPAIVGKKGKALLSWRVLVLPYVEHDELYKKFKLDEAWDSEHNLQVMKDNPMPKVFGLPGITKDDSKETYFRVFVGNGAAFEPLRNSRLLDFTDGTSNTLLIATAAKSVPWTKPEELMFDPKADPTKLLMFEREGEDGCNVVIADGSVRYLKKTINMNTLRALITRGGGEVVNIDE
ncbi:MAG: DUF1559 domain-containing protein [Fimbriiglobus sp.]